MCVFVCVRVCLCVCVCVSFFSLFFSDGFILHIIFRVACSFLKLYFQYFRNNRGKGSLDMLHNLFFSQLCLLYSLVNGVD